MFESKIFGSMKDIVAVVEALDRRTPINRFNRPDHREAESLINDFTDLEKSFRKLLDELFPKLRDHTHLTEQMLRGVLHDIRDEFLHIHYHISESGSSTCVYVPDDEPDEGDEAATPDTPPAANDRE